MDRLFGLVMEKFKNEKDNLRPIVDSLINQIKESLQFYYILIFILLLVLILLTIINLVILNLLLRNSTYYILA
jgi:hypothetical protein